MAYPKEQMREKESVPTTLEGRLASKFDDLQLAREIRNPTAFDELGRSIEVLFKGIPKAYEELMKEKEELDGELELIFQNIAERAEQASDVVYRDAILKNQSYQAEWTYREAYEELIMEKLQKFDLIPIKSPKYASIESTPSTSVMQEPEPEEEPEEPEPMPKPKQQPQKKPKLSIKRKQEDDTKFNI